MLIKVLKTTKASKNQTGNECFEYQEGNIYDIYQELAEIFLNEGWGEKAIEEVEQPIIEEKAIEEVEQPIIEEKAIEEVENKAIDNLENKEFKPKKGNRNAK